MHDSRKVEKMMTNADVLLSSYQCQLRISHIKVYSQQIQDPPQCNTVHALARIILVNLPFHEPVTPARSFQVLTSCKYPSKSTTFAHPHIARSRSLNPAVGSVRFFRLRLPPDERPPVRLDCEDMSIA